MSVPPNLVCPRCGGREVKDLTRVRRGTGVALMVGSLGVVAALAAAATPIAGWVLPVLFGGFVLGVATLLGARRARYCPACNLRMEGKTDDGP